jgi:CheY-like chemotaxis protein
VQRTSSAAVEMIQGNCRTLSAIRCKSHATVEQCTTSSASIQGWSQPSTYPTAWTACWRHPSHLAEANRAGDPTQCQQLGLNRRRTGASPSDPAGGPGALRLSLSPEPPAEQPWPGESVQLATRWPSSCSSDGQGGECADGNLRTARGTGRSLQYLVRSRNSLPVGRPLRILIADDHADCGDSLAIVLQSLGHTVALARNGREAVDAARGFGPDAILLDLGMPVMDGFEAFRQIRTCPECQRVFVAALTGRSDESTQQRCEQAGFDAFFVKPRFDELLDSLTRAPQ